MKLFVAVTLALFLAAHASAAELAPYQKPGAAIRLVNPVDIVLDPHSAKTLSLEFAAPTQGQLSLQVKADQGIIVTEDGLQYRFALDQAKPQLTLNIQSLEPGRYHLMFHAEIVNDGAASGRVLGVAIQVGPRQAQEKSSSEGAAPTVIIMQGEESVR